LGHHPGSHRRFLDLERQATSAIFYSGEVIHGMLQTEGYARALLRWSRLHEPEVVERLLKLRLGRGAVLSPTDRPALRLWCILGEAALRSGVGGTAVMCEQLEHLITMAMLDQNVVIQVLPLGSGAHALMGLTVTLPDQKGHRLLKSQSPGPRQILDQGQGERIPAGAGGGLQPHLPDKSASSAGGFVALPSHHALLLRPAKIRITTCSATVSARQWAAQWPRPAACPVRHRCDEYTVR
jgi:Domain of unknown function (DUF5753)